MKRIAVVWLAVIALLLRAAVPVGAHLTGATATATATIPISSTRVITYTYDGLQRLTGAVESPGSSFAYAYDLVGNRTGVTLNGSMTSTSYDAADQVVGWTYDGAGNLTSDGTTNYNYDALNHLSGTTAASQANAYTYNGDGTLVSQTANGTTTSYTQDLAASQSQILAATTGLTGTDYLYGQDIAPLTALSGGIRIWYGSDGQGSVRQTLDDTGSVLGNQNYDPFGQVEAGSTLTSPFGYTGELQNGTTGQEYLRARWYQPGSGTLLGVDPALASTGQPYAYGYDNPLSYADPTGQLGCDSPFIGGGCDLVGAVARGIAHAVTCSTPVIGGTCYVIHGVEYVTGAAVGALRSGAESALWAVNGALTEVAQSDFSNGVNDAVIKYADSVAALPATVRQQLTLLTYYVHHPAQSMSLVGALVQPLLHQELDSLSPWSLLKAQYDLLQTVLGTANQLKQDAECGTLSYHLGYEFTQFVLTAATLDVARGTGEGLAAALRTEELGAAVATNDRPALKALGCGCFPGSTGVKTPHGVVAIASLHIGDLVLAEDPTTGKITPEPVLALIDDGIKPLMAARFSDGSSLRVTTNHPFYVDRGPVRAREGWVQAGDLRVGDRVRTAGGRDMTVTSLRYDVGTAHVYTLTVATNHDFFVGSAGVLVHNTICWLPDIPGGVNSTITFGSEGEARAFARTKIGSDPLDGSDFGDPGKLRSQDQKWQYRALPGDIALGHIHLEELDPATGRVLRNFHLTWPAGRGR